MKCLRISWELLVTNMVITYPALSITIPKLSSRPENVNIEMQVRDRHADEHWALRRLGGDFTGREKGRHCSLDHISKVFLDRHQKSKPEIKFHLYFTDSHHQKIKKIVTWGLNSQKFYVFFTCNPIWSHSLVVCALLIVHWITMKTCRIPYENACRAERDSASSLMSTDLRKLIRMSLILTGFYFL